MSNDERQHQMDFILQQQAVFHSKMVTLEEKIRQQGENIDKLAATVAHLAETVKAHRQERQEAINNLIIGNEATRELANQVAKLVVNVSQRLTNHEQQPHGTDLSD